MARVLTPNQELLRDYLWQIKTRPTLGLLIVAEVWEEDATIELLRYIQKTREKDPQKLYEVAVQIAAKYDSESLLD